MAPRYYIFHVQNRAYLLRNRLAIAVRHTLGFIDGNADETMSSSAFHFDLHQLDSLGRGDSLRDFLDFGRDAFFHCQNSAKSNKKVGFRPLS